MISVDSTITRAMNGLPLSREEARHLVAADFRELLNAACRIRTTFCGSRVHLCAIVNARSGSCAENCAFCAQSDHHAADVAVHTMLEPDALLDAACGPAAQNAGRFGVVTSGRFAAEGEERQRLIDGLKQIKKSSPCSLCVSLGGIDDELLVELKKVGVSRIHHNLETSRNFFPSICTTHSYDERVENVKRAQQAGFTVCCGGLFGIGESWDDRIDMAFELRDLGIKSVPLNFLNPMPGTPLQDAGTIPPREALRIIALYRFILPQAEIKIAGGREVTFRDMQSWIFHAGASAMMIGNYLTTAGRTVETDLQMVRDLGLIPVIRH
jgi:biotin synthase